MNVFLNTLQTAGVCVLAALSFGAMAADTFTMNGRAVQLEPAAKDLTHGRSAASKPAGRVVVRDMVSGHVSVYAEGLIITLKEADQRNALLQAYPALSVQYAPGVYVYARVPRDALAATFDALGTDPRVSAVHLRPLPVKVKPR